MVWLQAAPATLKAAFLQPIQDGLATAVSTDLFAKTDADFMDLFVGGRRHRPLLTPLWAVTSTPRLVTWLR